MAKWYATVIMNYCVSCLVLLVKLVEVQFELTGVPVNFRKFFISSEAD